MCNQKSNTAFNNKAFIAETITGMHQSMERLYQFVHDNHQLSGQSALARRMDETPQVVKNWESRGISEGGALRAQNIFGCNANWLLGTSTATKAPAMPGAMLTASDNVGGWQWPFWSVSPKDYALLTAEEKAHLENGVLLNIKNRAPPAKQSLPADKLPQASPVNCKVFCFSTYKNSRAGFKNSLG